MSQTLHDGTDVECVKDVPNIVLVGSTGAGKSSLGNWLFNYSYDRELFERGKKFTPGTQSVISETVDALFDVPSKSTHSVRINLIDTPGLNEQDSIKDVKHMVQLLQTVHKLKNISMVVVCVPFESKEDPQTTATLKYYKELFDPLFSCHQVWIVLTHVSSETFEQCIEESGDQAWRDLVNSKGEAISKILGIHPGDATIRFVNSIYPKHQLRIFMEKGQDEYTAKTLLNHSAEMRHEFLTTISLLKPVPMDNHRFPLPPCLEIKRKERFGELFAQLTSSVETAFVTHCADLHTSLICVSNNIERLQSELHRKSAVQHSPPEVISGNSFIGGQAVTTTLLCPVATYVFKKPITYDCSIVSTERLPGKLNVVVEPNFIHLIQRQCDGRKVRWFARLQVEYSGEELNREEIKELKQQIQREQIELASLESELRAGGIELGAKRAKCNFMGRERFTLSEIADVLLHTHDIYSLLLNIAT